MLDLFQIVSGKELAVMVNVDRIAFVQEAQLRMGAPAARIYFSAAKDDFVLVGPQLQGDRCVDAGTRSRSRLILSGTPD